MNVIKKLNELKENSGLTDYRIAKEKSLFTIIGNRLLMIAITVLSINVLE